MKYWRIIGLLAILIIGTALMSGCVTKPGSLVAPTTPTPQIVYNPVTVTHTPTIVSTPSQTYKTADLALIYTQPKYGFKIDYPSEWTYKSAHSNDWSMLYIFSSADKKSNVYVGIDNGAGAGLYLYPLDTPTQNSEGVWADNIIKVMSRNYCHDGAGNPIECSSTASGSSYYYRQLISNEAVTLSGNVNARKLVFAPDARDTSGWWSTYYLMHAGKIQGYNFTLPGHPEVAVKVDGPVWDYGMGGQAYEILLKTPDKQVNATSAIFDHMVKSFEVTSYL